MTALFILPLYLLWTPLQNANIYDIYRNSDYASNTVREEHE